MSPLDNPEPDQLRRLAAELAKTDPGPAGELACALADAFAAMTERVDSLWQLIAAVVDAAGLEMPETTAPPEFVQALDSAQSSGHRGMRLTIGGQDWVAAISPDQPAADPGHAWAALERLTRVTDEQADRRDDA